MLKLKLGNLLMILVLLKLMEITKDPTKLSEILYFYLIEKDKDMFVKLWLHHTNGPS